ncbi:hypothetical protein K438DRAFT_1020048 [Mycena galopus ATCC 62051]|nr:hypothetical protein K438DRAFT_1020048 [Mycena galopus ATCC 62051]
MPQISALIPAVFLSIHSIRSNPWTSDRVGQRMSENEEGGNVSYAMNSMPDIAEAAATLRKSEERSRVGSRRVHDTTPHFLAQPGSNTTRTVTGNPGAY